MSQIEDPPQLGGCTRSTRSQTPEGYGKVYTFSALSPNASNQPRFKQTISIPSYMNV